MPKIVCKYQNGLILQVGPFDHTRRRVQLVQGENDVEPDFWDAWLARNRESAVFTSGMLYQASDFVQPAPTEENS